MNECLNDFDLSYDIQNFKKSKLTELDVLIEKKRSFFLHLMFMYFFIIWTKISNR